MLPAKPLRIFISLSFLCTASFAHAKATLDRLEATVNASTILRSDIDAFRRLVGLRAQLDRLFMGTPLAKKGASASDAEIVDFLIEERLICSAFPVSDQEVEQTVSAIVTNNRSDRAALKAALQAQGYSYDDYFELMRVGKCKNSLVEMEIRPKVSFTEEDLRHAYENGGHKTGAGGSLAQHIQLLYVATKDYKTPALAKKVADEAFAAIKNGEDFGAVTQRVGTGPLAAEGGDLGVVQESGMDPAIREQVRKLNPGEVSPPFGSAKTGGFKIVKLIERTQADSAEFNQMKDRIRDELAAVEYQRQLQLWLERQKQKAFIHRAGEPASSAVPKV